MKTSRLTGFASFIVVASAACALDAEAGSQSASLGVSATVINACNVTAASVNFGTYETTSQAPNDATGQIAVICSVGTPYSVGLSAGTGTSTAARSLTSAGGTLGYNLYQDSARSVAWGSGADTVSGTYTAAQQPLTVYGRIAGGQTVGAGLYTDTVTVTITY